MVTFEHSDAGTDEKDWAASSLAALPELPLDPRELAALTFVILAAHPDDESLGTGGLMARLAALGASVEVLLCTAGEASHPRSPTTTREGLAAARLLEFQSAVREVGFEGNWHFLGLPDGKLADHRDALKGPIRQAAARSGGASDSVVLVAPYRSDGHPDHDVLGSAAAELAGEEGYGLLEYPVWYWLWAGPHDGLWQSWVRLPLSPAEHEAKVAAMSAHTTQIRPLSTRAGDEVLLPAGFLQHFRRPFETFAWHAPGAAGRPGGKHAAADAETIFDAVHGNSTDPWSYTTSWYEQRKRSLTLAILPKEEYAAGLEVGCSIGVLSAELAARCGSFLAIDASSMALRQATERLAHLPGARARHMTVPVEWPADRFDLVVVSEVGYYLSPAEIDELAARVEASLLPGGTLLLCHWRHPVSGWQLDGAGVHSAMRSRLGWSTSGMYSERDFILEVLAAPGSPAADSAAPGAADRGGR